MNTTDRKWLIEVTDEQLRLIANCIEDCSRFASGQCELWHTLQGLENKSAILCNIEECARYICPSGIGSACSWNGAGAKNEWQRDFIKKTHALYREMLHQLAIADNLDNVYTYETFNFSGNGGLPIVKIKE